MNAQEYAIKRKARTLKIAELNIEAKKREEQHLGIMTEIKRMEREQQEDDLARFKTSEEEREEAMRKKKEDEIKTKIEKDKK